jgi:hypothetical protein
MWLSAPCVDRVLTELDSLKSSGSRSVSVLVCRYLCIGTCVSDIPACLKHELHGYFVTTGEIIALHDASCSNYKSSGDDRVVKVAKHYRQLTTYRVLHAILMQCLSIVGASGKRCRRTKRTSMFRLGDFRAKLEIENHLVLE